MNDFIRLRQIALAVPDLEAAERQLCDIFGVITCHHDERVQAYGLHNAVLTLGATFIELLAPTRPDTAVGRFLDRGAAAGFRGAYMAIFDCSDLAACRGRVDALGIRVVNARQYERYANLQLHPRDTGAALVEIHHNIGGDDLFGHYEPGGEDWQRTIRDERSFGITGVQLLSPQPRALAERWSSMLGRPLGTTASGLPKLVLELGRLQFLQAVDQRECIAEIEVAVRDVEPVLEAARQYGCSTDLDSLEACGLRFRLHVGT